MRVAIHQPNYCPWFPFFYKMAMVDKFIILSYAQFEKNGYQNRYKIGDKWITKPVESGMCLIRDKNYADGLRLYPHNMRWILAIKETLGIDTKICYDIDTGTTGTRRLIDLINYFNGNIYVMNPSASEKYLDESMMADAGIEIEPCSIPLRLQKSTFEILEEYGIDGAIKQLPRKLCKV